MEQGHSSQKALQAECEALRAQVATLEDRVATYQALFQQMVDCRPFVDRSLDMLCIVSFDGYFQYVNPQWEVLGYSNEELYSRPFADFIHPDDREATLQKVAELFQGEGELVSFENRYLRKDGTTMLLWWNGTVDTENQMIYASARDVSQHREMEQELQCLNEELQQRVEERTAELQASELRYRSLFEHATMGIFRTDPKGSGRFIDANPAGACIFGYDTPEEMITSISDIGAQLYVNPHDRKMMIQKLKEEHGRTVVEIPFRRRDGETFDGRMTLWTVYNEQGEVQWLEGMIEDITERKRMEAKMQRYADIIQRTVDGVSSVDTDQNVILVNPAFLKIVGLPTDTKLGEFTVADGHPQWAYDKVVNEGIPVAIEKGVWESETALLDQQTGEEIPVSQVIISHRKEDGTLDFLSTIVRDLREQKQAEEERTALQEQVIAAQRDALREISTPLIPLTREILLMPLIGAMDTQRAQQMVEVLLEGVASYQADMAIVDITGIQVVDTQVANALMQAAKAVRLLGANIVLTGIGPTMAQTLIHLGTDLSIIVTRGTLQSGIEYAFSQTGMGGDGRWQHTPR